MGTHRNDPVSVGAGAAMRIGGAVVAQPDPGGSAGSTERWILP
jgi:hypothetical protein